MTKILSIKVKDYYAISNGLSIGANAVRRMQKPPAIQYILVDNDDHQIIGKVRHVQARIGSIRFLLFYLAGG